MHVFLIAAITADGKIGQDDKHVSTAWTSSVDKKWFHQRTKEAGVVVMGSKTYATVGRPLPGRVNVVMSSQAESDWEVRQKNSEGKATLIYTKLNPKDILARLAKEKYPEVAICGGSSIYTVFAQNDLIDTYYLTMEPIFFGQGLGLFNQPLTVKLALSEVVKMGSNTLLLTYKKVRAAWK